MDQEPSQQETPLDAIVFQPVTRKRPPDVRDDLKRLIHWLYTNNPFYVVSAALVFIGLWQSFVTSGSAFPIWALTAGLANYTLLLAATAWFLIRYGNLWQDVRTLLVLVVLMLLAISVSSDRCLVENPQLGMSLSVVGMMFAISLSELLLRGIRLHLPLGFRLPYYASLALFFLYPIALRHWVGDPDGLILKWGMFGFSTVAGAVFLTLVPAIRRGTDYVSNNGSPWNWPWYPWVLFVAIGLGVCLRAYYLCISFHAVEGSHTIFGLYFLVPFLWVAAYLLLEIALVSQSELAKGLSVFLPLGLVLLALTASPAQAGDLGFLRLFYATVGSSPLFLTLLAVSMLYVVALLRKLSDATFGFALTLAAFSLCGPGTFNLSTTWGPYGWPVLLLGILFLVTAVRKRSARDCLLGAWCIVFMLWIDLRASSFAAYHGAIPIHLLLACVLVVGAIFRDPIGKIIQTIGAVILLVLSLTVAVYPPHLIGHPPQMLLTLYPLVVAVFAVMYGFINKNSWFYASAIGSLCGWFVVPGWNLLCQARRSLVGMDYIIWGIASFLVAMLLSLLKMRFFHHLYERWRGKN